MLQCADVLGEIASSWALPCVPAAGIQAGMFIVPPSARRSGSSSSRATPTTPSEPAASGVSSQTSPSSPPRRRHSSRPEHRPPNHRPEHPNPQRRTTKSGHRRHCPQNRQRRHDRRQRNRHLHQQRARRDHHYDRSRRCHQRNRAHHRGRIRRIDNARTNPAHGRYRSLFSRRLGHPDRTQPGGLRLRHAHRNHRRPLRGCRMRLRSPRRQWSMCNRPVGSRRNHGVFAGTTRRHHERSLHLRSNRYSTPARQCTNPGVGLVRPL
jgi:hypothetical protein